MRFVCAVTTLNHISPSRSAPIIAMNEWHFVTVEYSSSNGLALLSIDESQFVNQETWVSYIL